MVFDTVNGPVQHNVDVDDGETLDAVLPDILWELKQRGSILKGNGQPQVVWGSQVLDLSLPLRQQNVYPNEVLRVSTIAIVG
jgi:hypothetical protein